jgi:hypothetical protein
MHIQRSDSGVRTPARGPAPQPYCPRPYYATMLVLLVHSRDGGWVDGWWAPRGRASSNGTSRYLNRIALASVRLPLENHRICSLNISYSYKKNHISHEVMLKGEAGGGATGGHIEFVINGTHMGIDGERTHN